MYSIPNFLILAIHLLITLASNSIFSIYIVDKFTNDKIGADAIGYLIFGIIGLTLLFLTIRFFKIIIIHEDRIYLVYPFLLWIKIIKKENLAGFNCFRAQMIRTFSDFDFAIIKTKSGEEFIISDFIYWKYNSLFKSLTENLKMDDSIEFMKIKHLYILVPLFVITIISISFLAS